jgi:probable HAF family extracellular repeat protein
MAWYSYTTLNDPLASGGAVFNGINASGQIVGQYLNGGGVARGFLYSDGTYTILNDPLAAIGAATIATGINDSDQMVGYYRDSNGTSHAFLYSNGSYTTLTSLLAEDIVPYGINDSGQVVGSYFVPGSGESGFLYSNGTYTNVDDPSAKSGNIIVATGINDSGQIVGNGFLGTQVNAPALLNDTQVNAVFEAVLQRPASATEQVQWAAEAASVGGGAVISDIVDSTEAQANVWPVIRLYALTTGALPDVAQLQTWIGNGSLTFHQMTDEFIQSSAFASFYGDDMIYFGGSPINFTVDPNAKLMVTHDDSIFVRDVLTYASGHSPSKAVVHGFLSENITVAQFIDFIAKNGQTYAAATQDQVVNLLSAAADNAAAAISATALVGVTHANTTGDHFM